MTKIPSQNIIALIYDFDGTLTPCSMQEYTVFKDLGIHKSSRFWKEVDKESRSNAEDPQLAWMRRLTEIAQEKGVKLTPKTFSANAGKIKYFPGVTGFFGRINRYVQKVSHDKMEVRHYILSSGLKEILNGIKIKKEFFNIFGSEYHYNAEGWPTFPKVVITDTIKTQYIFRVNKGKEKITESINSHMPEENRPVPFKNIIYLGDGLSDVPAMNVTKKNGGYAIAVYNPKNRQGKSKCNELLRADRVHFIAPADYRLNTGLSETVQLTLKTIIQKYLFDTH